MASSGSGEGSAVRTARLALRGSIAAALIATFGTVGAPLLAQRLDHAREDRREAVQATGAARVLFVELLAAASEMEVLANDRIVRRFDDAYSVRVPSEDLRLIAASLEGESWGDVQVALTNVGALATFMDKLDERGRRRLTSGEVCLIRYDIRSVLAAAGALAELADAPGDDPRVSPLTCAPRPGPLTGP